MSAPAALPGQCGVTSRVQICHAWRARRERQRVRKKGATATSAASKLAAHGPGGRSTSSTIASG